MNNLIVKEIGIEDLHIAVSWAAAEGWNPGLHDAEAFYLADPHGFFMAFENGRPAGSISAVAYDENFGFIGFFIVRNDLRGHHIGIELGKKGLGYLGKRCVGQDGVLKKVTNYEHYGFKLAYKNIRYEGIATKTYQPSGLINLSEISFDEICRYDRLHFPAERRSFLKNWITQPDSLAFGMLNSNHELSGYGVVRKCVKGYKIGPLFADSADIAETIFLGLINYVENKAPFYLDIPEVNEDAMALVSCIINS